MVGLSAHWGWWNSNRLSRKWNFSADIVHQPSTKEEATCNLAKVLWRDRISAQDFKELVSEYLAIVNECSSSKLHFRIINRKCWNVLNLLSIAFKKSWRTREMGKYTNIQKQGKGGFGKQLVYKWSVWKHLQNNVLISRSQHVKNKSCHFKLFCIFKIM